MAGGAIVNLVCVTIAIDDDDHDDATDDDDHHHDHDVKDRYSTIGFRGMISISQFVDPVKALGYVICPFMKIVMMKMMMVDDDDYDGYQNQLRRTDEHKHWRI